MVMQQRIERLFAGQEGMKAKLKAWYEMRGRGEAEGKAYLEKLFAK
jgi:hypothetical protein